MKKALVLVGALFASVLMPSPAWSAPNIEFLNPSDYSTTATLADKTDANDTYHIVAWVQDVPSSPLVEFEIAPAAGVTTTIDAQQVGTDTWEADLALNALSDGPYTLRAILYSNLQEVDSDEQTITVNRSDIPPPPEPETVEMTHPSNSGPLGFFTPKGKQATTVIDGIVSSGALQARALYTLTGPGNDPEWVACGSAGDQQNIVRVECTLAEGVNPSQVTAVALVANQTPAGAPAQPGADQTGDAHRIIPYASQVSNVDITPGSTQANPDSCTTFVATLLDQQNRPVSDANIDIHAVGPDDQLRFATIASLTAPVRTSAYQPPDSNHPSSETSWDCDDDSSSTVRQGDHNLPGQNDVKHIESTTAGGTTKDGQFTFAVFSATVGGTEITAWGDNDDDDQLDASEVSGGAVLGWGQPPPAPSTTLELEAETTTATMGDCVQLTAAVRSGGNPQSGRNVDVHLLGPTAAVQFCDPGGGSALRAPDQGDHVGDAHSDGTRHAEGETGSNGLLTFGVSSGSEGSTQVTVWLDSADDDVPSSETTRNVVIDWGAAGERTISIDSNKNKVRSRGRVVISGSISGAPSCADQQNVRLRSKKLRGGRFRTIGSTVTDDNGDYSFTIRPRKSKRYKTVARPEGVCEKATSRKITVRVT